LDHSNALTNNNHSNEGHMISQSLSHAALPVSFTQTLNTIMVTHMTF